ncbi:MAG: segregation/condensation protein A [bacterium]|nr:segregation/condensation protein A [bacterium]
MEQELYNVRTESFEGPLDLLLHLIKKNKMDILEIKISEITSEYLYFLEDRSRINLSREGDFLMTASTLIYIKSRSLLPKPDILGEESPEQRLIHTLIEYDKIQKISRLLKEMEKQELLLWKREEALENYQTKEFKLEEVSAFQLAEIFLNIVKKREREEFLYIDSKEYSIEKKWGEMMAMLETDGYLNFTEYLETLESIQEVLVSFFTMLEMVKRRVVVGVQKTLFDTISLWKTEENENGNEPVQ